MYTEPVAKIGYFALALAVSRLRVAKHAFLEVVVAKLKRFGGCYGNFSENCKKYFAVLFGKKISIPLWGGGAF
jgi:hypothetical protein